jgi:hypothetical protein
MRQIVLDNTGFDCQNHRGQKLTIYESELGLRCCAYGIDFSADSSHWLADRVWTAAEQAGTWQFSEHFCKKCWLGGIDFLQLGNLLGQL